MRRALRKNIRRINEFAIDVLTSKTGKITLASLVAGTGLYLYGHTRGVEKGMLTMAKYLKYKKPEEKINNDKQG